MELELGFAGSVRNALLGLAELGQGAHCPSLGWGCNGMVVWCSGVQHTVRSTHITGDVKTTFFSSISTRAVARALSSDQHPVEERGR